MTTDYDLAIQGNRGSILPWFNLNRGQNRHVNTLVEWLQSLCKFNYWFI